jgi:hypothetical protein
VNLFWYCLVSSGPRTAEIQADAHYPSLLLGTHFSVLRKLRWAFQLLAKGLFWVHRSCSSLLFFEGV